MAFSDEDGVMRTATPEQVESAYDFELFDFTFFPLFLGEVMCIFEGNVGILNIYSQQNEPKTMFLQTAVTHLLVGMLCIVIGCLSYGAYGSLTQDIVFYNLPRDSSVATMVSLLYMFNIVGSISITIQPIYGLFEKVKAEKAPQPSLSEPQETLTEIESVQEFDQCSENSN